MLVHDDELRSNLCRRCDGVEELDGWNEGDDDEQMAYFAEHFEPVE